MKDVLKDIRSKLENRYYQCEEHIRLSLVSRILKELGWDIWNPMEVNTEYKPVQNEDSTKVDIALFQNKFEPTAFIEIKPHGKLDGNISFVEKQLRNYCRDNTAIFSIMTDGQLWRFYYSQTGGEFSNKCFKVLDVINDDIDKLSEAFMVFLSKESIEKGIAKIEAEDYLQLNKKQRAIEDAIPLAKTRINEYPYPRMTEAIVEIVTDNGIDITISEVESFLSGNTSKTRHETSRQHEEPQPKNSHTFTPRESPEGSFLHSKPVRVFVAGEWYPVRSWKDVKVVTYKAIYKKLVDHVDFPERMRISNSRKTFTRVAEIFTGMYIEINLSSNEVVKHCKHAMVSAGYDPDQDWSIEVSKS